MRRRNIDKKTFAFTAAGLAILLPNVARKSPRSWEKDSLVDVCVVILGNDDVEHKAHLFLDILVVTLGGWTNQ